MSIHIPNLSAATYESVKAAFNFAKQIFNESDIDYSILSSFSVGSDVELTDNQANFLYTLLVQYYKSLVRKKQNTPKQLYGYKHACETLPVVKNLLATIAGHDYVPSPLEKKLYEKLFNLFQQDEPHVMFSSSEYRESYPEIIKALDSLENAGVLFFISKEPDKVCVELDYQYSSTFVEF